MTCRALLAALLALLGAGAAPARGEPEASSAWVLARADPRLCPSPMCGGLWVHTANARSTVCGDGARRDACYAASADLGRLRVDAKGRELLARALTEGRALARARLVPGRVSGFPELDTLVVSEIWTASGAPPPRAGFHRLRDNGIRCVRAPCFTFDAVRLGSGRRTTVSALDLSRAGPPAERVRALLELDGADRPGVLASGRIVRERGGGRAFVATRLFFLGGRG